MKPYSSAKIAFQAVRLEIKTYGMALLPEELQSGFEALDPLQVKIIGKQNRLPVYGCVAVKGESDRLLIPASQDFRQPLMGGGPAEQLKQPDAVFVTDRKSTRLNSST